MSLLTKASLAGLLLLGSVSCTTSTSVSPTSGSPDSARLSGEPPWFASEGFTGKATWNATNGTLTFTQNISFGQGDYGGDYKNDFYFQVPNDVNTIIINNGVTVTGGFRVNFGSTAVNHNVTVQGQTAGGTARVFGTNTVGWVYGPDRVRNTPDDISDSEKWKYGLFSTTGSGFRLTVKNLKLENSRAYNITSFSCPITVDNCFIVDSRATDGINNDGFGAAAGSIVQNSTFQVTDDAIKLYKDITVTNVTINLRRNGAAFQLGWGSESTNTATITNVLVNGQSPDNYTNLPKEGGGTISGTAYNRGLFSWVSGSASTTRTITINGLKTTGLTNAIMFAGSNTWRAYPTFEVGSTAATISMSGSNLAIACRQAAANTKGNFTLNMCGSSAKSATYNCGTGGSVTGDTN